MIKKSNSVKLIFLLIIASACATLIVQAVHELGHSLTLVIDGRDPIWNMNGLMQMWDQQPNNPEDWYRFDLENGEHGWLKVSSYPGKGFTRFLSDAAGPFFSLCFALLSVFWIFRKLFKGFILALISVCSPLIYYLRGPFRNYGDEASISSYLGVPKFFVDLLLFSIYIVLIIILYQRHKKESEKGSGWNLLIVIASMLLSGFVIMGLNPLFTQLINQNDRVFFPIFGISFPVFIINLTALIVFILVKIEIPWNISEDSGE